MFRYVGPWLTLTLVAIGSMRAHAEEPRSTTELGGYVGVWLPPDNLGLFSDEFLSQGHQPLKPGGDFGVRGGYYFLPVLGAELEAGLAPTSTDLGGRGVIGWTLRTQLVGRFAIGPVMPFALLGAGLWAVTSEAVGDDLDPAFQWGIGTSVRVSSVVALRADLRGTFSEAFDSGLAHGVEILGGATFALGRREPREERDDDSDVEPEKPRRTKAARDEDDDGVEDSEDECPHQKGVAPKGCPAPPDGDADGVADTDDKCPQEKGPGPEGCPTPPDGDADGVPDDIDVCPEIAGDDGYGCPKEPEGGAAAPKAVTPPGAAGK